MLSMEVCFMFCSTGRNVNLFKKYIVPRFIGLCNKIHAKLWEEKVERLVSLILKRLVGINVTRTCWYVTKHIRVFTNNFVGNLEGIKTVLNLKKKKKKKKKGNLKTVLNVQRGGLWNSISCGQKVLVWWKWLPRGIRSKKIWCTNSDFFSVPFTYN